MIQTRQKLKEAYDLHFAATIERAEKQAMLARHGRRLLNLLDDTPVVPGDTRPAFEHAAQARQILNDAEEDLRDWQPNLEPIHSTAGNMGANLMPAAAATTGASSAVGHNEGSVQGGELPVESSVTGGGHYTNESQFIGGESITSGGAGHITSGEESLPPGVHYEAPDRRAGSGSTGLDQPQYTHSEADQSTTGYQ